MLDVGQSCSDARHALRALCPQPLLNWREARFYGRYGEVELHLLEFLCRRDADAIDVGANDGSYVHYLRRQEGKCRAKRGNSFTSGARPPMREDRFAPLRLRGSPS